MIFLAFSLGMVATAIEIRTVGTDGCPETQAVEARLKMILSPSNSNGDYVAWFVADRDHGMIRLELRDPLRTVLGSHSLDASLPCRALTEEAAVVLAAWIAEIPSVLSLDAPPEPSGSALSERPPTELPKGSGPGISVAPLVSIIPSGPVAAGSFAELSLRVDEGGTRASIGTFVVLPRNQDLGSGHYDWMRTGAQIGLLWPIIQGSAALLEARIAIISALLTVRGHGYAETRRTYDLDPAASLGLRLTGPEILGSVSVWLEVSAVGWFRPELVVIDGLSSQAKLPRLEILNALGVSWGDSK
jgi:hypothetical protein